MSRTPLLGFRHQVRSGFGGDRTQRRGSVEDAIRRVAGIRQSVSCVNTLAQNPVDQRIVEEQLRVNSYDCSPFSNVQTLKWMCTARPRYQPGKTLVNRTCPVRSVI